MVGEVVIPPSKKLEDLIRLSELCVDLLRQNEEFYAEVSEKGWKSTRPDARSSPKIQMCLYNTTPITVSYTHLTLPTTPYV